MSNKIVYNKPDAITLVRNAQGKLIGIKEEWSKAMTKRSVIDQCKASSNDIEQMKSLLDHCGKHSLELTRWVMQVMTRIDWQAERRRR